MEFPSAASPTRSNLMKAHHLALRVALAYYCDSPYKYKVCMSPPTPLPPPLSPCISTELLLLLCRRRRRCGRRQASLMEGKKERPVRRPRRKPSLNLNSTLTQLNSLCWPCCALPRPCYCAVATCNEMKANSGYISLLVVLHVAISA